MTSKLHIGCISPDQAVSLWVSAGNVNDVCCFERVYRQARGYVVPQEAIMDRGYDSRRIRSQVSKDGVLAVIPYQIDRKDYQPVDLSRYRHRNQVERLINKLKNFRRVATRYDKLARCFRAFAQIALLFLWIKAVR